MKIAAFVLAAMTLLAAAAVDLATRPARAPSFASVRASRASSDFVLEDSRGGVLSRKRRDFSERRQEWVAASALTAETRALLLSSEDRRFDSHDGVDVRAIAAAAVTAMTGGGRRGGSTITMQLAKRLRMVRRSTTWLGKIRQIRSARALERTWSKDRILEAYVNLAPFRGELVGFPAAARAFFGKNVDRLSPEEASLLVASLRAPNASPDRVAARACALRPGSCAVIRALAPAVGSTTMPAEPDLAPQLAVALSAGSKPVTFRSSIDRELQIFARNALSSRLRGLRDRNVRDGAAIVVENATGRVLAAVGSAGPFSRSPQVDGTRALRQAGSTLKPFLYALAFERKLLRPDSWLEDSPVDLVFGNGVYRPRNHDRVFHGWIRARTALASSLNVPAVKVLRIVGLDAFADRLGRAGLELDPEADYGPALALGVADLSLRGMARAYLALANGGRFRDLTFERDGISPLGDEVLSPGAVAEVESILSSAGDRSLGFGFESGLELPFHAALKTGTSKDMRDNWCLGWTRDYTIAVWVGNFDGEPMWDVSGLTGAAPAWTEIARWLHDHRRSQVVPARVAERAAATPPPIDFPRPRIEYPPTGLVMALDPEIPRRLQKVPLIAAAAREGFRWRVDGETRPAGGTALWDPRRGRHRIELLDAAGVVRDEVLVQVR